ncbi:DUF2332 domain-containing protein [Nocardia sp. 004]|uniref:DUF2332 domain-containing protein n=1 Tax=Nocardia sp. 004 TaxID=3385978 RepID=UPI00399FD46B
MDLEMASRRYRRFAEFEARGSSSCYESWAWGIASDPQLLSLIDRLPEQKRQPNLVFAAARFLGVGEVLFPEFKDWVVRHWDALAQVVMTRTTQTNEVGRAAAFLPVLAQLTGPLALIEVGASAGLCLYPDLFSYRYDDRAVLHPVGGTSGVTLRCVTTGEPPIPIRLPEVVWRAGVDLNPLDVNDADQMRWLECLVWPGQPQRLQRLRAAVAVARSRPVSVVSGDLNATVAELVAAAPDGATVVVFHSAVLAYLSVDERIRFEQTVRALPCHWLSNEGCGVIESVAEQLPVPAGDTPGRFVVALDGTPLGYAGAHGQSLEWIGHRAMCAPHQAWISD